MLEVKIFDVDHGFCAMIDRHDNHVTLIDVGFDSRSGFSPWQYILRRHYPVIDCLVLPSYVQDHLDGIPDVLDHFLESGISVHQVVANPTLAIKNFPSLQSASLWARNPLTENARLHPECQRISQVLKIDDTELIFFWNSPESCQDLRDLSIVTFFSYKDINIVLPSDLKTEGWRTLLRCSDFCERLRRVNIFVASNHGQESGYCSEVFDYCNPELVIVSSEGNQPASAAVLNQYKFHAKGSPDGVCDRKVLTTYDKGTITISKCLDRLRQVTTEIRSYRS